MNFKSSQFLENKFECVVSIFEKSIVFCQPKVGTRFFLFLSNWPKPINETNNQYQITFQNGKGVDNTLQINTLFDEFNAIIPFTSDYENTCNDYNSFFSKTNVNNINQFFFQNSKDMYFVVRNPIKRFLSGISQVASAYVSEYIMEPDEKVRIKLLGNLTDLEIDNIYINYNEYFNEYDEFNNNILNKIDINIFVKIVVYILNYKSELYYYDNHTQNYLHRYKELIYNIEDKGKVKIIDLEDCNKKTAYDLFNNWSDTINYTEAYYNTKGHIISNKKLYDYINFILTDSDIIHHSIYNFLSDEISHYNELKNSKYFIKL